MLKKYLIIISFFLFVNSIYAESSSSSINWLSQLHADTLYCKLTGCTINGNLTVNGKIINATIFNSNVTNLVNYYNISQYWSNASTSFVPVTRTITFQSPLQGSGNFGSDIVASITQVSTVNAGYVVPDMYNTWNNKINQSQADGLYLPYNKEVNLNFNNITNASSITSNQYFTNLSKLISVTVNEVYTTDNSYVDFSTIFIPSPIPSTSSFTGYYIKFTSGNENGNILPITASSTSSWGGKNYIKTIRNLNANLGDTAEIYFQSDIKAEQLNTYKINAYQITENNTALTGKYAPLSGSANYLPFTGTTKNLNMNAKNITNVFLLQATNITAQYVNYSIGSCDSAGTCIKKWSDIGEPSWNGNFSAFTALIDNVSTIGNWTKDKPSYLPKSGGTMAGALSMNGYSISYIGTQSMYQYGSISNTAGEYNVGLYGGNGVAKGAYMSVTGIAYAGGSPGSASSEFIIGRNYSTNDNLISKFNMMSYSPTDGLGWRKIFRIDGFTGRVQFVPIYGDVYFGNGTNNNVFNGNVVLYDSTSNTTFYRDSRHTYLNTTNGDLYVYNNTGLGTVHALSYLTSTGEFTSSQSALTMIKNSTSYVKTDAKSGTTFIDHSAYGDCARDEIIEDKDRPVIVTDYRYIDIENKTCQDNAFCQRLTIKEPYNITTYPYTKIIANASVDMDCLRARYEQAIFESYQIIKKQDAEIKEMKATISNQTKAINDITTKLDHAGIK